MAQHREEAGVLSPGSTVRADRAPLRVRAASAAVTLVLIATITGCGSPLVPTPSPTPIGTHSVPVAAPTSSPSAPPRAVPALKRADTIRIGWTPGTALDGFRGPNFAAPSPSINFAAVVNSGLYRYDGRYALVPDLADGPCLPRADPKVIRCRLVATTFHDGTPLTADDVAYTILLFKAVGMVYNLDIARVVDDRTVEFVLPDVDPTFLTTVLPTTPIFSRREVEARYADFLERAKGMTAVSVQQLLDSVDAGLAADPPDCPSRLGQVDALLTKLGAHIYREDYPQPNGSFDPCAYLRAATDRLSYVTLALKTKGLEAVAHAVVGFQAPITPLVGTGPYRLVSETAQRVHLEAFAGYHAGVAATPYIDFGPGSADASPLLAGTLDILQGVQPTAAAESSGGKIVLATVPTTGYQTLTFNVRPGRLFGDVALRRALRLCIDVPADVDVATGGRGTPLYAPVLSGSWAADAGIPKPVRDVAAARRLIEGAGWHLGPDGTYAKGPQRLAAKIVVRDDSPARLKMADLIGYQARDCGMALETSPTRFAAMSAMMAGYPHDIPGTATPFDILMVGWVLASGDPAMGLEGYASSAMTDATHSNENGDRSNFGGFSDPTYDGFLQSGRTTYDQAERVRLYVLAQRELASMLPVICLWEMFGTDAVRTEVATADGPLDLQVPNWAWQPERLIVEADD